MCVDDVCEVQVAGRVVGFVSNAEVEEPNPHRKLLLDAFVLQGRASRPHMEAHYMTIRYIVIVQELI